MLDSTSPEILLRQAVRLRFDSTIEPEFRNTYLTKGLRHLRILLLISMVLVVLLGMPVPFLEEDTIRRSLILSYAYLLPILVSLFILSLISTRRRWLQPATSLGCFLIGLGFVWFWTQEPDAIYAAYGLAGIMIVITCVYTVFRIRFVYAAVSAWGTTAAFLYGSFVLHPLPPLDQSRHISFIMMANIFGMLACYFFEFYARREFVLQKMLDAEKAKSDALLANVLPQPIAERLKQEPGLIAEDHEDATVVFADIAQFTRLSSGKKAADIVAFLDTVFSRFDRLAEKHHLEKIKTVGDSYMLVGGIHPKSSIHTLSAADCALDMMSEVEKLAEEMGTPFTIRIGIHAGPVAAGVIGRKRLIFDLWGDTVNTASRMESQGIDGCIQITEEVAGRLGERYNYRELGLLPVKGKGDMKAYILEGKKPAPQEPQVSESQPVLS
jgi:class 3 adenylate cyclase